MALFLSYQCYTFLFIRIRYFIYVFSNCFLKSLGNTVYS